ncbi:MAG: YdbL family protein [Wenzhouxiangella sp.]
MTSRLLNLFVIALVLTLAACVTINVYFPEAAAERAADRFIQDVLGENGRSSELPLAAPSTGSRWSGWLIASAYAQAPNINIDTPQIQAIKQRMAERHREHLSAWLDAGAIGLDSGGLITIRDRAAVSLADRRNLERIVGEENADRRAVYREIAVANGRPEWENEIRETFARQWIANARSGWFYQGADGSWNQK